jgi:hypothetical protein
VYVALIKLLVYVGLVFMVDGVRLDEVAGGVDKYVDCLSQGNQYYNTTRFVCCNERTVIPINGQVFLECEGRGHGVFPCPPPPPTALCLSGT